MNWTISINGERMSSDKCPHCYVDWSGLGKLTTNWHACGHPSAAGCPCAEWACPCFAKKEVSDGE